MDPEQKSLKKRNRGHNKKICFSEEVVTKDAAQELLSKEDIENENNSVTFMKKLKSEEYGTDKTEGHQSNKRKKNSTANNQMNNDSDGVSNRPKKKKRKEPSQDQTNENEVPQEEDKSSMQKSENSVSKRSLKRMKKQQIEETRKLESDIESQKKALTYLSNWKYNKTDWKFEKLRQVWLVQNLYNSTKIDEKYWDTVVEYFTSSQGKVRQKILDDAIKIVENDEMELADDLKHKRARDLVQNL